MDLPVQPPLLPMLAKAVSGVPVKDGLIYEPKWDGFRCIIFRDGDEVELGSRNTKPLTRYFPEMVETVKANTPERCVLDGEIVIVGEQGLNFDLLSQRIHPAKSRVTMLSQELPSSFVAFDLLAIDDENLCDRPFSERRKRLEQALAKAKPPMYVTPATDDPETAEKWFNAFEGAGLDGIVSKPSELQYVPNKRLMFKTKHERVADCVVAGFRWHKTGDVVGSLLLGLYDEDGGLQHVGITASFTMEKRRALVEHLKPYTVDSLEGHPWQGWAEAEAAADGRKPGAVSRWNAKKDLSWIPLRPELVVEVAYDHLQGDRFRHATTFKRWREDRDPQSCTYDQLETPVPIDLRAVLHP